MTLPLAQVLAEHPFPFQLRRSREDFVDQYEAVESLADYNRAGLYAEVGTGKTAMATALALCWNRPHRIVIMPPVLLKQWEKWLNSVGNNGDILIYRGNPKERKALALGEHTWTLMTIGILKRDFKRIKSVFGHLPRTGIVDEATSVKNSASGNHKAVAELFPDSDDNVDLALLTGTPLSTPHDAYAYVKLISPGTYRSKGMFDNVHVEQKDFYDKVLKWKNIDIMQENLMAHSVRLLKGQVLKGLKEPNYIPINYDLDPAHMALYRELAEEQLLILETGGKIDATSSSKLYNALQQIVVNYDHFTGDETKRSTAYDLIDHVMDEAAVMDPKNSKLIIASYYKMTSRAILQYLEDFGAVGIYGDISAKQQEINSERFKYDPTCRILVMQPASGGFGSDYQHVCSETLFIEAPRMPIQFNQVVGRTYRDGQQLVPNIHIGIANGTIQGKLFNDMLTNDELLNKIQLGFKDLRAAVYGAH